MITRAGFVKAMSSTKQIEQWGMLYCGGAAPVNRALEEASKQYKVAYKSESFDW